MMKKKSVSLSDLKTELDNVLKPSLIRDPYCPNGLQVEGKSLISTVCGSVSVSEYAITEAIKRGADALFVHHGMFWNNQNNCITGLNKSRLELLIKHNISLFAYHLPLDAHETLGNNAQIAKSFGFKKLRLFGHYDLGWFGTCPQKTASELIAQAEKVFGRKPNVFGNPDRELRHVAWCSGGAPDFYLEAIELGADAFITGEFIEPVWHIARETGTCMLACGHHATERGGVRNILAYLKEKYSLDTHFIDSDNPI